MDHCTQTAFPHAVTVTAREKASLSGVTQVISFDDSHMTLLSHLGEITLTGQDLHVTRLMLEEGEMTVEGRLDGLFYTDVKERRRRKKGAL